MVASKKYHYFMVPSANAFVCMQPKAGTSGWRQKLKYEIDDHKLGWRMTCRTEEGKKCDRLSGETNERLSIVPSHHLSCTIYVLRV